MWREVNFRDDQLTSLNFSQPHQVQPSTGGGGRQESAIPRASEGVGCYPVSVNEGSNILQEPRIGSPCVGVTQRGLARERERGIEAAARTLCQGGKIITPFVAFH